MHRESVGGVCAKAEGGGGFAAETHDIEDRKTFSHVMLRKNPDDCREAIYQFESERRAGEMDKIRSLPALLTKRLSGLPDRSDQ